MGPRDIVKEVKIVENGRSGTCYCFKEKNTFFSSKMRFKKELSFIMMSQIPYGTHSEVVINRVKFDVGAPGSFRGVKTELHCI